MLNASSKSALPNESGNRYSIPEGAFTSVPKHHLFPFFSSEAIKQVQSGDLVQHFERKVCELARLRSQACSSHASTLFGVFSSVIESSGSRYDLLCKRHSQPRSHLQGLLCLYCPSAEQFERTEFVRFDLRTSGSIETLQGS